MSVRPKGRTGVYTHPGRHHKESWSASSTRTDFGHAAGEQPFSHRNLHAPVDKYRTVPDGPRSSVTPYLPQPSSLGRSLAPPSGRSSADAYDLCPLGHLDGPLSSRRHPVCATLRRTLKDRPAEVPAGHPDSRVHSDVPQSITGAYYTSGPRAPVLD